MRNNYIVLKFGKVFIMWENNERKFYKEENGKFLELSFDEMKIVSNIFDETKNDNYYSERIEAILNDNNDIDNKEFIIKFLNFLENIIPEGSRENLYRNLKTLKVKLNLDTDFVNSQDSSDSLIKAGNYNVRDNALYIEKSYLKKLWEISQKNTNPEQFFWNEICLDILHELGHMASSSHDSETNISYCGFDKYPSKQGDSNRGLTEGMTEVIAMTGVPNSAEASSSYYIEALFVNQIIQIIGVNIMLESYFSNKGTSVLEKELDKYKNESLNSHLLFRRIESNFYLKGFDVEQGILASIQSDLIDYYENKILYCIRNGLMSTNEINQSLTIYENMLITSQKLSFMNKFPSNYIGLDDSVRKFYIVKEKINNELLLENNNNIIK